MACTAQLLIGQSGILWHRAPMKRLDEAADRFDTINQGWGYTGNYHQYAFGLERDKQGNFYGTLGLPIYSIF